MVKGTFSDDHNSVFSHDDDDDERGGFADNTNLNAKLDQVFEFNPFAPCTDTIFEIENAPAKQEENTTEHMKV